MDLTEEFKNDQFVKWFIIAAISDGSTITDEMSDLPREITMQINNVEIDPLRAMKRLEEEFDRNVELRSKELVEDMKNEIFEPFENKVQEVTDVLNKYLSDKVSKKELPNWVGDENIRFGPA